MSVTPIVQALVVGGGGAAGAVCRHAVGLWLTGRRSLVAIDVVGSVALGAVLAAPAGQTFVLVAGVGFCGAFTTFSSLAVEAVRTAADGDVSTAVGFAIGTVLLAVAGAVTGSWLVRLVW
jgi:CrcB protein